MATPIIPWHRVLVPLSHGYMEYVCDPSPTTKGAISSPSHYVRTVDYSQVVDACLDDLKEGRYL